MILSIAIYRNSEVTHSFLNCTNTVRQRDIESLAATQAHGAIQHTEHKLYLNYTRQQKKSKKQMHNISAKTELENKSIYELVPFIHIYAMSL